MESTAGKMVIQIDWPSLTIGRRIRTFRAMNNLTGIEVAATADISKSFLSEVENDKRNMSVGVALRICAVLGVSPNWLLTGREVL